MIDLVCLVADRSMQAVVETILKRHQSLGIRAITTEIIQHPQHDPGCYGDPCPLLSVFAKQARHAMVILDRAWDGIPAKATELLEADVEARLSVLRPDWAKCVVIDPELEIWLFTRSPRLDDALGWRNRAPSLAESLAARSLWPSEALKPVHPKDTMKWALKHVGKQTSSSIYRQIAEHLGLGKRTDASFQRFRSTLQGWFPAA